MKAYTFPMMNKLGLAVLALGCQFVAAKETSLLWGDTQVHASWSVEAYSMMNHFPGPEEACRMEGVDPGFVATLDSKEVLLCGWRLAVDIAERNYIPGTFTTFAGWECTRNPCGNQHRIVFNAAGPEQSKQSSSDGPDPEDLWNFLDTTSQLRGIDFVSMSHNSNLFNGTMFTVTASEGRPLDAACARTWARWEPVMEITQAKGSSEVHPEQSPGDKCEDFAIHTDLLIGGQATVATAQGTNPFKLGIIGSSNTLTGLVTVEEDEVGGRMVREMLPGERAETDQDTLFHALQMSASAIAAVWAEENTCESVFSALKRSETCGTSSICISLRVYGGFDFTARDACGDLVVAGYRKGVPMGGDLAGADSKTRPAS